MQSLVVPAVGAIGFGGLVAITGGAITWLKFRAAQLPADQAVNVIPKHELVTIGAAQLLLFGVVGMLVVGFLFALDRAGRASAHTTFGLIVVGVAAGFYAATRADRSLVDVLEAGALAALVPCILLLHAPLSPLVAGSVKRPWLRPRYLIAAPFSAPGRRVQVRWLSLCLRAAAAALVLVAAWFVAIDEWWFVLGVLIGGVLLLTDLGVARVTDERFRWFGAAVFVSVALFGFSLNVLRTFHAPEIQPAIVLRGAKGSAPLVGIYITQTSDRIYLGGVDCRRHNGKLQITPRSGRIYWVPLKQVSTVSIGPSKELSDASRSSARMVEELKRLGFKTPNTVTAATSAVPKPAKQRAKKGVRGARPKTKQRATKKRAVAKPQVPPPGAICVPPKPKGPQGRPSSHGKPVGVAQGRAAARRFRPWLLFDGRERWRPINVATMFAEYYSDRPGLEHHRLCEGVSELEASCADITSLTSFENLIGHTPKRELKNTFVDLSGATPDAYCAPKRCGNPPNDCNDCRKSAIYYRVTRSNSRLYVDYWWFLRFNLVTAKSAALGCVQSRTATCFNHEGDWEGVTVVTGSSRTYRVAYVTFAEHDKTVRLPRAQVEMKGERPVVYVANGTHAAYPHSCASRCTQAIRRFFPEGRHDGKAAWGRNPDGACFPTNDVACLRPLPESPKGKALSWNGWTGHWGSCGATGLRCKVGIAPVSPSRQPRYQNPSCFDLGSKPLCDSPTPGSSAVPQGRAKRQPAS